MPRKRYAPDAELLIERLNELDPETAVMVLVEEYLGRAALVTPPVSPRGWQGGMPLVPAWCIDHAEMEVVWRGHHIPVRATPPESVGGREALLREAAERVLDWHDHHEQWEPTGYFAALYAATGRRQPKGDEPVGPRYYGLEAAE